DSFDRLKIVGGDAAGHDVELHAGYFGGAIEVFAQLARLADGGIKVGSVGLRTDRAERGRDAHFHDKTASIAANLGGPGVLGGIGNGALSLPLGDVLAGRDDVSGFQVALHVRDVATDGSLQTDKQAGPQGRSLRKDIRG